MAEKDIQNAIMQYLKLKNIFAWKQHNVGIYKKTTDSYIPAGMPGVSDILGILPDGRFLAIEVKTKSGKLTDNQKIFLERINVNNGVAFTARSVDDVINKIKQLNI